MPRYVILAHDYPELHWDLMLERGDVLRTWRLWATPTDGETVSAEAIADHRPMYLDYEGPVSNNRGTVARWDGGVYAGDASKNERVEIDVRGGKLEGNIVMLRQSDTNLWTLRFRSV